MERGSNKTADNIDMMALKSSPWKQNVEINNFVKMR